MAKCKQCGRKGIFFKVNHIGICKNCEILNELENKQKLIEMHITEQSDKLQKLNDNTEEKGRQLEQLEAERQKVYSEIKEQAEKDAVANVQAEIGSLTAEKESCTVSLENKQKELTDLTSSFDTLQKKYIKTKTLFESYQAACKKYLKSDESCIDDAFLATIEPTVEIQLNCMNVKKLRSLYTQNQKLIKDCLARYEARYNTKANITIYKLMTIALEAELQNILYNINYGKLESAEEDVKEITAKYLAITIDGNQNIAPTMKKFIGEIEVLFIEAVRIEYEYFVQKERIKEEQRALREQMKQEAEERKQLEAQRKQVEKEESKYHTEMQNVREQIANSADAEKIAMLENRLSEIQLQLDSVEKKKDDIIKLQNGKAGYVYVISNLGSFGDDVFKVGMTRRLEPMERVKELGDASVPFPFDVHSFIFSEDAVGLEHTLHVELNERRLNKVNLRKEFFKVSINELEELVYQHQPTAEFNRTMLAEQYNQSLSTDTVNPDIIDFEIDE